MRTTLLDLPAPSLTLPPWSRAVHTTWSRRAERASALSRGAGTGRHFEVLLSEARSLLEAGDTDRIVGRAGDRRFLRAVLTVWNDDADLARRTMVPSLLGAMRPSGGYSRLTTITAAVLLFEHFDTLDEWHHGLFDALCTFVRDAVATQTVRRTSDLVEVLRSCDALLLEREGPRRLADHLVTVRSEPVLWFKENHLGSYADSRLGRVIRDAFYLAWIAAVDAERGEHRYLRHITSEVVARQRSETTDADGRYFGHHVLEALTAKQTRHPSASWLEAVLAIGGDPRMRETDEWQRWWPGVSSSGLTRATRWMQGVNLTAFLDGVEAYARNTYNSDMQRMLERRRRFLTGLYEQDRIDDVRLILGDDIRTWIRRNVPAAAQGDISRLSDTDRQETAVIYVECDTFSLVEGSHNFKLHVYAGGQLPELSDRRTTSFSAGELRIAIPNRFQRTHGEANFDAFAHDIAGAWLRKALDFLRSRGVRLDERALMTAPDYTELAIRRARIF
ncbi:EH signature domain-containing protein [Cellulomonas fengjieae]|uniref:Zorya protein ZorC EH domain-containing protein n=1 Tax=Cellulomonas fengjieae TaxID=2819978 RepID=A0ABS3SG71_9CELL|nr:EH signature domain-containing protein [Cellulomonas fengjieae]MBO3084750.1 hypothetical protein [Cellulomonas fengjieae]QVI66930.1 hypothetical protein KG102_04910 [Cellulomonas fengjieae]